MADLPDLDPSNIGFLAYYNVLDNGDTSDSNWNPEDVTSYTSDSDDTEVTNYTIYDNGVDGELNHYKDFGVQSTEDRSHAGTTENVSFRAKSDGWVLLYTKPRSEAMQTATRYTDDTAIAQLGKYNAAGVAMHEDKYEEDTPIIRTFNDFLGATSAGSISGSLSWYDYDQTDATNWSSGIPAEISPMSFSYTDTTNVYSLWISNSTGEDFLIGGSNAVSFADYVEIDPDYSFSLDIADPSDATGINLDVATQPNTAHEIRPSSNATANYFSLWG